MKSTKGKLKLLPIAVGIAAVGAFPATWAADGSEKPSMASSGIEEVIVTARKTEESVQVVPLAVKALSSADLEKQAVLTVNDLRNSVPGLFIAPNSQGGAPTFAIRAAKADNGTSDTVTAYIGDVPVASTISIANMTYDMQSISVLKGPQGTLFGANSTGGAIIFRPNMPTDKFEGYVDVGIANYNRTSFQGMVNLPVNDVFQARIAADVVDQSKGFLTNVPYAPIPGIKVSGYNGVKELGNDKHESARVSFRLRPNKDFTNDLEFDYYHRDDQSVQRDYLVALRSPYTYNFNLGGLIVPLTINYAAYGITPNTGSQVHLDATPTFTRHKVTNIFDTANYDISDQATLKVVLGYQDVHRDTSQVNGGSPALGVDGRHNEQIKKYTFEPSLDLKSDDGRLRNKTGLFFSLTKTDTADGYAVIGMPIDPAAVSPFLNTIKNVVYPLATNHVYAREFRSHAIYNQVSYDLTKELTASLGLRYTWDSAKFQEKNASNAAWATGWYPTQYGNPYFGSCAQNDLSAYSSYDPANCKAGTTTKSQAPSFTFTLEDRYNDQSMIYATLRGGYLVGGFNNSANPVLTGMPTTFQPEKVVDFETGIKSDWTLWNRPIRSNLAVFYGNYKNQQRVQNGTSAVGATFIGVVNAGSSSFYGFDLDGTYELTDNFELSASWNHIESEYTKFTAIINIPLTPAAIDLSGQPMSQTPKDQVHLGATIRWPLSTDVGLIRSTISYSWTDKTYSHDSPVFGCTPVQGLCTGPSSPAVDFRALDLLKAYDLVNFTTSWKGIMGSKFDANFWVKNLFDKKYNIYASDQMLQFGYATAYLGDPRTFGLNVRYNF